MIYEAHSLTGVSLDREAGISNPDGIRLDIGFDFVETTMQGVKSGGEYCAASD